MNQLEDPEIIETLCEASAAGVPVDLIVRGFCCLSPGVPGGRKTFAFAPSSGVFLNIRASFILRREAAIQSMASFFIGSADWMFRNLSKRIEVATPIPRSPRKGSLWEILEICLRDRRQAWELDDEERYTQLRPDGDGNGPEASGSEQILMRMTAERIGT